MGELPVVVIGAGPVGLAAAAELRERDLPVVVVERGPRAGAAVREWGHVRLFSPWSEVVAPAGVRALDETDWAEPAGASYPTGHDWAELYLEPLAEALTSGGVDFRWSHAVVGVGRAGRDRLVDAGRDEAAYAVHLRAADGTESVLSARSVIDASGTWSRPNSLGADGYPAPGETAAAARITYGIPDFRDAETRERFAGRHIVLAGTGASAMTVLVGIRELARSAPDTRVTWLVRRPGVGNTFGGGAQDQLVARGALGQRAKAAVDSGLVTVRTGFRVAVIDGSAIISEGGDRVEDADEIIAVTGFRPDLGFLSELRLDLDAALEAPRGLAPLIDPNVHSCGTVYPHGAAELEQPEHGFYLVGMKAYGRAPTFLALTGFEQVRSVVAAIAGDQEAAAAVELSLPDTGVCGGAGLFDEPEAGGDEAGCCGSTPTLVAVGNP